MSGSGLERILRGVFQLLESSGPITTKAPALSQQIASHVFTEAMSDSMRIALNGLSAALDNVNCISESVREDAAERKRLLDAISLEYERIIFLLRSDPSYAALGQSLPTLRPVNYKRNFFHIFNAVFAVTMYEFFLTYVQCVVVSLIFLLWYVSMDVLRRFFPEVQAALFDRLFASITRPRERFIIPAATWYCLSMFIVLLCANKTIAEVSVLVLGVGDPAATLIGRTFRSRKILGQKSLAGCTGFICISAGCVLLFLAALRPEMTLLHVASMAVVAGVVGALAELFSNDRIDDNLTIPLAVAAVLSLLF